MYVCMLSSPLASAQLAWHMVPWRCRCGPYDPQPRVASFAEVGRRPTPMRTCLEVHPRVDPWFDQESVCHLCPHPRPVLRLGVRRICDWCGLWFCERRCDRRLVPWGLVWCRVNCVSGFGAMACDRCLDATDVRAIHASVRR